VKADGVDPMAGSEEGDTLFPIGCGGVTLLPSCCASVTPFSIGGHCPLALMRLVGRRWSSFEVAEEFCCCLAAEVMRRLEGSSSTPRCSK
jgi:hypothetical protein